MNEKQSPQAMHKSTKAIHVGGLSQPIYGEVSPPIFQSATFSFPSAEEGAARFSGKVPGYIYSRLSNPTVNALEENIASLENGYDGLAAATGMAAITTIYLSFLDGQSHLVGTEALYGASRVVLETEFSRFGVTATFVDTSDLGAIEAALQPNTKMVYIETPSNPTMKISDIKGAAKIAHKHRALLVVDNTFASPYLQRPIEHGADIVVESCTKFLNGHSDVVGGIIVTKTEKPYWRLRSVLKLFGGTMDPHQAWLILRGVRTLPLRLEKAQENAMKLTEFLRNHPKVTWLRYPGLSDHPQYSIAKKQMD
ncbi:MAG: trans-sulfuration enzyme family protein, partial [Planctomycetota bacterium]